MSRARRILPGNSSAVRKRERGSSMTMRQTDQANLGKKVYELARRFLLSLDKQVTLLACDFVKELGYENFCKPDVHLKKICLRSDSVPPSMSMRYSRQLSGSPQMQVSHRTRRTRLSTSFRVVTSTKTDLRSDSIVTSSSSTREPSCYETPESCRRGADASQRLPSHRRGIYSPLSLIIS